MTRWRSECSRRWLHLRSSLPADRPRSARENQEFSVLAPARMPLKYRWFNLKWGSPNGRLVRGILSRPGRMKPWRARLVGCFGFQGNNTTRAYEYPWAFHAVGPRPGLKVLEIGGSLSGFQFALSQAGCEVVNVDPGDEFFTGLWPANPDNVG